MAFSRATRSTRPSPVKSPDAADVGPSRSSRCRSGSRRCSAGPGPDVRAQLTGAGHPGDQVRHAVAGQVPGQRHVALGPPAVQEAACGGERRPGQRTAPECRPRLTRCRPGRPSCRARPGSAAARSGGRCAGSWPPASRPPPSPSTSAPSWRPRRRTGPPWPPGRARRPAVRVPAVGGAELGEGQRPAVREHLAVAGRRDRRVGARVGLRRLDRDRRRSSPRSRRTPGCWCCRRRATGARSAGAAAP